MKSAQILNYRLENSVQKEFTVYILSNASRRTYIGLTSNLEVRLYQHREKVNPGFTRDHNITMLVYYEQFGRSDDAIARERQLKTWSQIKKHRLIEVMNPIWSDLSADLGI